MSFTERYGWKFKFSQGPNTNEEYTPTRWHAWRRLCNLCPELDTMHVVRHYNQKPPPRPMTFAAFVSLAASFACPVRREILRALIFDLMKPDLLEIMKPKKG